MLTHVQTSPMPKTPFSSAGHILLLGSNKAPDFVTLNLFACQVTESLVLLFGTGHAQISQQFNDWYS